MTRFFQPFFQSFKAPLAGFAAVLALATGAALAQPAAVALPEPLDEPPQK